MAASQMNGKLWFDHATKNLGSEMPGAKDKEELEKIGREMAEQGARTALERYCADNGRTAGELTFAHGWLEDNRDGKPITVSGQNAVHLNWLHVAITYPAGG